MRRNINYEELVIWGGGLIGCTLATAFSKVGMSSLIIDVSPTRVAEITLGTLDFLPSKENGSRTHVSKIRASVNWEEAVIPEKHQVHFLCIPTEKDGKIDFCILSSVIDNLCKLYDSNHELCLIIESTISPAWLADIVHHKFQDHGLRNGVHYHVCCSPRRDWFIKENWNLTNMPKIIGSDSREGIEIAKYIYSHVCDNIEIAVDAKHAALTKVIENFYRYNDILLANQLTQMLPDFDISETLRLVSTKWNMNLYHPSLGIGGYCVPLAKEYLREIIAPARLKSVYYDYITEIEALMSRKVKEIMLHYCLGKRVGILGLAYAPELKIHALSPTLDLLKAFQNKKINVKIHDPLYPKREIFEIVGTETFVFPEGLHQFDVIIMVTGHDTYMKISDEDLFSLIKKKTLIIDNLGSWKHRKIPSHIQYIEVGNSKFLSKSELNLS